VENGAEEVASTVDASSRNSGGEAGPAGDGRAKTAGGKKLPCPASAPRSQIFGFGFGFDSHRRSRIEDLLLQLLEDCN
jgi:hypothetical protein